MKKVIILITLILAISLVIIFTVNNKNKNTSWIITQYGDNSTSSPMMCYTIEGDESGLIIIDGGYENNEKILKNLEDVILKHNNKVDAWIITHFDSDHAGAYITLSEKIKNLNVENVYIQEMPDIELCKANASWCKDWSFYEKCLDLDIKNKHVVYSGDEFELIGLKIKVLSSYDEWVDEKTENLLNNGSMVFKISGNKENMLFCSDVQVKEIEDFLIENYKEELKSKYLQVPHHGNAWLTEEFYEIVDAEMVLFDASEALIKNYDNVSWYTTEKLVEMFEKMETKICYFNTAPNKIELK